MLACINIGDNPITGDVVNNMLNVARKCENLESVKGTDQLLAPVKLRSIVENNAEGRTDPGDAGGAEKKTEPPTTKIKMIESDEDDDEDDECLVVSRECSNLVGAQNGGGEWDCLKCGSVSFNQKTEVSFNFKLAKGVGGVKKPVRGYTLLLCRKRFGLPWVTIEKAENILETDNHNTREIFMSKNYSFEVDSLAGDELSLWCRVEPLGKGEIIGSARNWLIGDHKNDANGKRAVLFKDGGGMRQRDVCWN